MLHIHDDLLGTLQGGMAHLHVVLGMGTLQEGSQVVPGLDSLLVVDTQAVVDSRVAVGSQAVAGSRVAVGTEQGTQLVVVGSLQVEDSRKGVAYWRFLAERVL